jgi:hypothetical protein
MKISNFSSCAILIGILISVCCPVMADADSQMDEGSGITFTPRFWLSTINPLIGVAAVVEAYSVPTYGGTVSFSPPGARNYSFSLSGLRGEGTGDALIPGGSLVTTVEGIPFQMSSTASIGESKGKRTDIEFLVRRTFPDKWFSMFIGFRYVTWRETTTARLGYAITVGPILGQTISDEQNADLETDLESNYYGIEFGFGTVAPIGGNGRHSLTSDFAIAVAKTNWEASLKLSNNLVSVTTFLDILGVPDTSLSGDHISTALDLAGGYQYKSNRFMSSIRYRLMVLYEENALKITQLTAISGPEVVVSISF